MAHPLVRIRRAWRKSGRLSLVRTAANAALEGVYKPRHPLEWTISLTDDSELHHLNLQFRGMDKPTDVLSFGGEGYKDGKRIARRPRSVAGAPEYLGDIVISMERCAEQANAAGHDIEVELALLVVHGTLHLLGFDHDTPARKARMWAAQTRALQSLGVDLEVA
jgi:probable rRNA maturation factor